MYGMYVERNGEANGRRWIKDDLVPRDFSPIYDRFSYFFITYLATLILIFYDVILFGKIVTFTFHFSHEILGTYYCTVLALVSVSTTLHHTHTQNE